MHWDSEPERAPRPRTGRERRPNNGLTPWYRPSLEAQIRIEFRILGPLELDADGRVLPLGSPKQRALLALLLIHANEAVSRERLIEELWGDAAPASVESAFHVYLSRLRRLLDSAGGGALLVRQAHGYTLRVEPDQLDATRFAALAGEGREALAAGEAGRAADRLRRALALWRGPALADLDSEGFALAAAARLEEERVAALEQRLEADLALGRDQELIGELEALVAEHPYRERVHAQLILALYRCGRQADALRAYQQARRTLADELGLKPGHELKELEQAILRQDPTLTLERPARLLTEPERPAPDPAPVPVVGRERETVPARRLSRRTALGAIAVALALMGAAVAVVATRAGASRETTVAADAVGLIDAHRDRVLDQVEVGAAPTSVAFGAGAVWVTSASANTVSRIEPETRSVRQTIDVGNSPSGIAVGGGGVWVANHDDGTVSWINPGSNTVVQEIPVGNGPTAVAFGYGSVWVTNSEDRTLSRIDAKTGDVVAIRTGAVGRGVAVGAGSVWVTDEATRTLVQVDPGTNRVTNKATVGSGPGGIVYADGSLWVANELDGTVSEIDATTLTERAAIPIAGSPSALAFADGRLWVGVEFGERVVRIDTRTRRKSAVLRVGNRPKGLAAVPGGVWIAVQASGRGNRGGRLVVLGPGLNSIDPARASSTASASLLRVVYDGLTAFRRVGGSEGTQVVPDLAAALPQPTDGGRAYAFRVRAGIRYSDGALLRAQDFKRALERSFTLGSGIVQDTALAKVVGASRCSKGRPCDLSGGVIVSGPNSLTIRLSAPDPRVLASLTLLAPVPARTPPKDVGTRPIPSTGPYTIESYVPGRLLTLVRNSHFRSWSPRARPNGYPDEIAWRIGVRPDEAVREVVDGKADLLFNTVPADRVQELRARYPLRLHLVPQRATTFVFLNTRRAPFDDIRVRRALNYAVDREKMAELHGGLAVARPTCQAVPPNVPGFRRRYCPYTADPGSSGEWKAPDLGKARELIRASGTKGERIVVWTFPSFAKEGRYFVSLLRRLGYRAQLKELGDLGTYFNTLDRTPNVQAGLAGFFDLGLAADVFAVFGCRSVDNFTHFCDPRFDKDVKRLAAEQANDPAAGAALAARLDREVVRRAPWVPLFTPWFADFTSKRVGNYLANTYASSTVLLDQLWVR